MNTNFHDWFDEDCVETLRAREADREMRALARAKYCLAQYRAARARYDRDRAAYWVDEAAEALGYGTIPF